MYEMLPRSGIGEATPTDDVKSIEAIRKKRDKSNAALIKSLREDEHAGALLEATEADWIAGRMTEPVLVDEEIPVDVLLHPRFSVAQEKEDGSLKIRPVDNMSWSDGDGSGNRKKKDIKVGSVNGHTFPQEKMRPDTLDRFIGLLTLFATSVTHVPVLIKVRQSFCWWGYKSLKARRVCAG